MLYYLKMSADRVGFSLWFLAEGIDRSVLVRYSGHVDATLTRMTIGRHRSLSAVLEQNGLRPTSQMAFIERVNLTIRQSVSFLTRRTWSSDISEDHLALHLQGWRCYYHFMRPHESLGEPIPGFRWKHKARIPAMALDLTQQVWTVREFIHLPLVAPAEVTLHSP